MRKAIRYKSSNLGYLYLCLNIVCLINCKASGQLSESNEHCRLELLGAALEACTQHTGIAQAY